MNLDLWIQEHHLRLQVRIEGTLVSSIWGDHSILRRANSCLRRGPKSSLRSGTDSLAKCSLKGSCHIFPKPCTQKSGRTSSRAGRQAWRRFGKGGGCFEHNGRALAIVMGDDLYGDFEAEARKRLGTCDRRTGRFWQRPLLLTVPSGRKTPIFSDVVSPPGLPAVSTFFSRSRFYFVLVSQIVWARRFKARVVYTVAGSEQIDDSPDSRVL